jgi:hypothetical protein
MDKKLREKLTSGPSEKLLRRGHDKAMERGLHRGTIGEFVEFQFAWAWRRHIKKVLRGTR